MDRLNTCKIAGCQDPILDRSGIYARLCAGHKTERQATRVSTLPPPAGKSKGSPLVAEAQALVAGARRTDRAGRRLAATPGSNGARQAFVAAAHAAQADPTEQNLVALTDATKEFRRGLPVRSKREREFVDAQRALTTLARSFLAKLERATVEQERDA